MPQDFHIRLERLPPMWVASVLVYGEAPEPEAWRRMRTWAEPRGLLEDFDRHPIFGFHNPKPSPDSSEYGYELWMRVARREPPTGEVTFRRFRGGLFAVARCSLPEMQHVRGCLNEWSANGEVQAVRGYELERVVDPAALLLDLYMPVRQRSGSRRHDHL